MAGLHSRLRRKHLTQWTHCSQTLCADSILPIPIPNWLTERLICTGLEDTLRLTLVMLVLILMILRHNLNASCTHVRYNYLIWSFKSVSKVQIISQTTTVDPGCRVARRKASTIIITFSNKKESFNNNNYIQQQATYPDKVLYSLYWHALSVCVEKSPPTQSTVWSIHAYNEGQFHRKTCDTTERTTRPHY